MGNALSKALNTLQQQCSIKKPLLILKTETDRYEVVECISRGTQVSVYRAKSQVKKTTCVIKVFTKFDASSKAYFSRGICDNKLRTMRRLQHNNIVQLYDEYEDSHNLNLVMELCDKGDLRTKLQQRGIPFSQRTAAELMLQILSALGYMHSIGESHGNIKLENILFGKDGKTRLTNVEHKIGAMLKTDMGSIAMGTNIFRAPELTIESKLYSRAGDMWACGVAFFFLLSGMLPFSSCKERFEDIRNQDVVSMYLRTDPRLLQVSPTIRRVLRELLQVDPKNRITSSKASALCLEYLNSWEGRTLM